MQKQASKTRANSPWWQRAAIKAGLAFAITLFTGLPPPDVLAGPRKASDAVPKVSLIGLGDSLTHGTMDATNNALNTWNAYLQKVAGSLGQVSELSFVQPFFNVNQQRIRPLRVPTNLGVDGADVFSVEGIEYYKRVGVAESYVTSSYLCDHLRPRNFADKYDKVLYPLNLPTREAISVVDAAVSLLNREASRAEDQLVVLLLWIGNNDTSLAALGAGGAKPSFMPFPFPQIAAELTPTLRTLLKKAEGMGEVSFAPYTQAALDRNMTDLDDFTSQYERVLSRLRTESALPEEKLAVFLMTLPYYSVVGYLFDSEDLEFYLKKVNPAYQVPPSFKRVAKSGEPITKPLQGDRVSIFTFSFMSALLTSGYSVEYVNEILEKNGLQEDGLVLSEAEQQYIMARIDSFNEAITAAAAAHANTHLIDIGGYLNAVMGGQESIVVGDRTLSRKWSRGGAFGLDGVHPGYTGQALVANYFLERINADLGWSAPLIDLEAVMAGDPYQDKDGDGWIPGPTYRPSGLTEVLFMLTDPNDQDPLSEMQLPANFWNKVSHILLQEMLGIPRLAKLAKSQGIMDRNHLRP